MPITSVGWVPPVGRGAGADADLPMLDKAPICGVIDGGGGMGGTAGCPIGLGCPIFGMEGIPPMERLFHIINRAPERH